jgi:hypothetical protein
MTLSVFFKILALGLLEYVHHHNFLYGLSVYSLHLFNNYTNM